MKREGRKSSKTGDRFAQLTVENDGKSLMVLTSGDDGWLMYLRYSGDAGFSSRNPERANDSTMMDFRLDNGQMDQYPRAWTYPLPVVMAAVKDFVQTGKRSGRIRWHNDGAGKAKSAKFSSEKPVGSNPSVVHKADPEPPSQWPSATGQDQFGKWADLTIKGVIQRFRYIPAGTFIMGCDEAETDAAWKSMNLGEGDFPRDLYVAPRHSVALSTPYWLADSLCTRELWDAVIRPGSDKREGGQLQVDASWNYCQVFLESLNARFKGISAHLPTEAEWEHACRAGSVGPYPAANLDDIAWYGGNSGAALHPVKQKVPNAWGLYDMIGNMWEWCNDWGGEYSSDAVTDPFGPPFGSERILRGGCFFSCVELCRSAHRIKTAPNSSSSFYGFRICMCANFL